VDIRRPWHSGGRARDLLGFTVSYCSGQCRGGWPKST
jgi:hypothetical protein